MDVQTCLNFHFSKLCCIWNDYALQCFFPFLFSLISCICCKLSTTTTPGLGFCLLLLTNCAPVRSCVVRGVVAPGPALSLPTACGSPFLRSTSTHSSTTGWLRLPFAPLSHNTITPFACLRALQLSFYSNFTSKWIQECCTTGTLAPIVTLKNAKHSSANFREERNARKNKTNEN